MNGLESSRRRSGPGYLLPLRIVGCAALGAIAWLSLTLHLRLATTGFTMLLLIVALSYLDSFVSSLLFSITAALLLNVYFTPPIFSFRVDKAIDYIPLVTFIACSLLVTSLVRRIRDAERIQRDHARLLDLTHDTVFVRDADDVVTYWNHAAEQLYGWRRDEALGRRAHDLLKTEFPAPTDAIRATYLASGEWEGELIHVKRDGTRVTVASRWAMQRDASGRFSGTLETNNNITRRKQAEARLRRIQAQYLEEAQRLSRTGSFGWNVETGALFWSAQAYEIFEASPDAPPSLEFVRGRIHPEDLPVFESMLKRIAEHADSFDIEHRITTADGRIKYLHVVAREAIGQGEGRQFIGAVMDITEARETAARLRIAQADLARTSRMMSLAELSASIAHEIGQPLAAVTTNAEACLRWLHRAPPNFSEVEACVTQIAEESNRAADIVQRVRRLMKGAPPEAHPVDVGQLVREACTMVRSEIDGHEVLLRLRLPDAPLTVWGDAVQLQQVMVNLMTNAIQAMASQPGARRLSIVAEQAHGDRVSVSVRDSGPGIANEDASRLFDAFFTTKLNGMGMGLAICRSILESHGGAIRAENGESEGAIFTLVLPCKPAS